MTGGMFDTARARKVKIMSLRSTEASRERALTSERRPVPDEAPLESPEPGVTDLGWRDYKGVIRRAARAAADDQITDAAAAIAYYTFLAIPALLLISVGFFSIFAGPSAVETIIDRLGSV